MAKKTSKPKRSGNHSAAFVIGSMVGGLVGAVAALWNTPQSGEDLRAKVASALVPGGEPMADIPTAVSTAAVSAADDVGSDETHLP